MESSAITNDMGRKKKMAAKIQRLMDDWPECAARAIHRGPNTAAMLNKTTSSSPISLRSREVWLVVTSSVEDIVEERLSEQPFPGCARDIIFQTS